MLFPSLYTFSPIFIFNSSLCLGAIRRFSLTDSYNEVFALITLLCASLGWIFLLTPQKAAHHHPESKPAHSRPIKLNLSLKKTTARGTSSLVGFQVVPNWCTCCPQESTDCWQCWVSPEWIGAFTDTEVDAEHLAKVNLAVWSFGFVDIWARLGFFKCRRGCKL